MSGPKNRLARESSPYLLLHAENPVEWYPWGEEAFERAHREEKPIFLSVGYSTCHWCHVMERESFSDPEIARRMNEGYVCVKVDREERPDLDEVYMTATQLLTGSGGWPNSVFLTHELKPFFAGTYFPPDDAGGRPGFPRVLSALRDAWDNRREEVLAQAEAITRAMREEAAVAPASTPRLPGADTVSAALKALFERFDPERGGFGPAPKFPSPSNLFFLMDLARDGDDRARQMLVTTLDRMARGGIHDQLGGGFHRYSTDAGWLVPHFEKMLYDNASLAALYAEAAPLAPEAGFERVARSTLDFVLEDMQGPEGRFLSAIDAETDGHEGAYYTWTADELRAALGADHDLLASVYGFAGTPPVEGGRHVLHLPLGLAERARALGLSVESMLARLEPGRRTLLAARGERKRPPVDDKVLTDWNGLMIHAMARAGTLLDEPRYQAAAARAAEFILARMVERGSGTLLHAYRGGMAKVPALLDDYAFLIRGFLELIGATGERGWLQEALQLQLQQDLRLGDRDAGGYFAAPAEPSLLIRFKPAHDGAVPSGNGIAALNLLELARLTGDRRFHDRAESLLSAFGGAVSRSPLAHATLVQAVRRMSGPPGSAEARAGSLPASGGTLEATAREVVKVEGALRRGARGGWKRFALELEIRDGWHVNANPASLPSLVPTEVKEAGSALRGLRYPKGEPLRAGSSGDTLSVYRGRVRIEGEVEASRGRAPRLALAYQPCDDTRCLPAVIREVVLR